jgi:hypothetical protein
MPVVHWTHDLATQNGFDPVHVVPQLPQLFGSELSSTHAFWQTKSPVTVHTCLHCVPSHETVPPLGWVHTVQFVPQAFMSLGTHWPPHECVPFVHWHVPPTQCSPPVHGVPQPPQLLSSVVSLTHAAPHCVAPLAHEVLHMPPVHWATVFGCVVVHGVPQPPQFVLLVFVSTQVDPHSIGAVIGHPDWQENASGVPGEGAHTGVGPEQPTPHAPQLGLTDKSVPHPAPASAQSAWPAAHWYAH